VPSLWYTPDAVFTHTWPLPAGGAFCVEGEAPPPPFVPVFDEVDFAAGAEFDAELLFEAGAAAGVAAGAADFDDEAGALELAGAAEESDDAAVDFFERDFLVVESAVPEAVFDASVFEADADFEESDAASVDESAAVFFDFFVVPVEEPEAVEAEESSDAALVFFDFEVPDEAVELSSDDAVAFFFVDFVDEPLVLESSVELPSAAAFFFFFFAVVLLSELASLDEPLADELDCAFADFAAIDAAPRTKTAQASAVNIFCQSVFMIVPPVSNDAKCQLRSMDYAFPLLVRPAA
jgi:hypothetical protein